MSKNKMKIYFVRHGQTSFNLHHVLMGQSGDIALDSRGIEQARQLAEEIANSGIIFEKLFSSPMLRARQTAEIISKKISLPVEIREELTERNYGHLEGESWKEIEKETGHSLQYIEEHLNIDVSKFGGEKIGAIKARLLHFLAEVKDKYRNKNVLVVSHSGIIRMLYSIFSQQHRDKVENATIHQFEI